MADWIVSEKSYLIGDPDGDAVETPRVVVRADSAATVYAHLPPIGLLSVEESWGVREVEVLPRLQLPELPYLRKTR